MIRPTMPPPDLGGKGGYIELCLLLLDRGVDVGDKKNNVLISQVTDKVTE